MKSNQPALDRNPPRQNARSGLEGGILRLVKSLPERRAIESGQIDAVIDPATGKAFLLPEAQRALREDQARVRSLLALSSDWCWEQDEHHRFVSHTGIASGRSGIYDESIIGKTLRDPPFDSMSEVDWQAHLRLLEWRAAFRDIELGCTDRAGEARWVSISGEPVFDEQDQFKGYRGTMRDITLRKQSEALAQKPIRVARDTLDALALQVCVLDSAGTVIVANKPSGTSGAGSGGIGAGFPEGANYLEVCDQARGKERADGLAIAAGIRQVIAGDSPLFRRECVCDSLAGRCWFTLTATAFPGDGAARVVVLREYLIERKRVERISGNGAAHAAVRRVGRKRVERLQGPDGKDAEGGAVVNSLLAALPRKDYADLLSGLEPVTLTCGEVLYEPGEPIRHVYFPSDSLVALLTTVGSYEALEVGLVGREGMVGISLALGMNVSFVRALVQGTGMALRMDAARFRKEFRKSLQLQRELYRYTHVKLTQARQTAACNRFHLVEARLARSLLMTRDRVGSDPFLLTQEFLADLLGVRRVAISQAAGALQQRKLISYSRGKIRVLDRKGLQAASCGCYEAVKDS
ncbi:MAG TPA: helix-turn-helix domain-containing protein [Burkholderiales bacterium]|nr:helix-turn-helix domain-containing protein [Burkholderiales bacterium]